MLRKLLLKRIVCVLRQDYGAITVMFAIIFPALLMFYSVAWDGANLQSSRARLADGLNQGVMAVAVMDNRNASAADKAENITLLHKYLTYYMPQATIVEQDLDITASINYKATNNAQVASVDYTASGKVGIQPLIGGSQEVGFSSVVDLRADSGSGVVRKIIEDREIATDYAFVLDFSGSMTSNSAEPGLTRIALLKKVVTEFMDGILADDSAVNNTVGIVPFTSGVPVRLSGENMAGGNRFGCSYMGKLMPEYSEVDFDFWYNKIPTIYSSASAPGEKTQAYSYDNNIYYWYQNVVSLATGYSMDEMVNKGWCVKNSEYGSDKGRAAYSCDADTRASLFDNYDEFLASREVANKLMYYSYKQNSIFNSATMDYSSLVSDDYMFSDDNVTTFEYIINSARPFIYDCYSAFSTVSGYQLLSNRLRSKTLKPASYLIELTNDRSIIDEFKEMNIVGGGTSVASGLLRAVPLIAKGENPRKVIIVISDGQDSDNGVMLGTLFKQHSLCDKIKEGLLQYPAGTTTESADIYFIFTVNSSESTTALNLWNNYCVGDDHVFLATNYQDLLNVLQGIAKKSTVQFINKNES